MTGAVVTFSEVVVGSSGYPLKPPYTLALIKLDEGGHLIGVLRGGGEKGADWVGKRVKVIFEAVASGEKVIQPAPWPRVFAQMLSD